MSSSLTKTSSLIAALIALPVLGLSASFTINGACEAGACPAVDTLQPGTSSTGSFDMTYTLGNTDSYRVFGSYLTQNSSPNGTTGITDVTAVYLGNSSGSTSRADLLTMDLLQTYNYLGSLDGTYKGDTGALLSGPLGNLSSFDAQVYYDGHGLGLMGPFSTPGSYFATSSATLAGLTGPLSLDFRVHFNFGAGSGNGATMSTLTPEPSSIGLSLAALIGLGIGALRTRKPSHGIL